MEKFSLKGQNLFYGHNCHDDHKSDAKIWSVTLESSMKLILVSFTLLDASFMMFIVQATKSGITYDHYLQ
jgi:hypothetical protein